MHNVHVRDVHGICHDKLCCQRSCGGCVRVMEDVIHLLLDHMTPVYYTKVTAHYITLNCANTHMHNNMCNTHIQMLIDLRYKRTKSKTINLYIVLLQIAGLDQLAIPTNCRNHRYFKISMQEHVIM